MYLPQSYKIKNILAKFRPFNGVRTPVILQQSETECGIAALAIVFSYFHHYVPLEILREECGTSRDGCKALTLIQVAKKHGFEVDAFKIEIDDLYFLKTPVIAFWNFSHYVVINGIGNGKVFINDPAHGPMTVNFEVFDKSFTGVILVLRPSSKVQTRSRPQTLLPMLLQWLHNYYLELSFLLVFLIIGIVGTLGQAFISHLVVLQYTELHANELNHIVFIFLAWGLFFTLFTAVQKWQHFILCANASFTKTTAIISHMLQLPFIFYSLRQKSEIVAILSRCEHIVSMLYKAVSFFCANVLVLVICLIVMYYINPLLTIVSVISCIIAAAGVFLTEKSLQIYERSQTHLYGKLYGHTVASIKNIETIIACGFETAMLTRWQNLFIKKLSHHKKLKSMRSLFFVIQMGNYHFSTLVLFYLGIFQLLYHQLSLGGLMTFYFIHLYLGNIVNAAVTAVQDIQRVKASHMPIQDLMQYPQDQRYLSRSSMLSSRKTPDSIRGRGIQSFSDNTVLQCNSVYFFYNKTHAPTLTDISCRVQSGEHVAIVGATGSGKSTLAKLLAALFTPHAGQILLYGRSISNYSSQSLATRIAYVSQDVMLFCGTIYDNLTLWKNHISNQQINDVLDDTCLGKLIEERGLQAEVGESGNTLSGGEKQRLEIARALLQNTPILILDEATSALDEKTETTILTNLKKRNQTILFVAHRLSSIKHCDQIWVMDQGKIIAKGTHSQLLIENNLYQSLWQHAGDA